MMRFIPLCVCLALIARVLLADAPPSTQPTTQPSAMPPGQLLDQMLRPSGASSAQPLKPIANLPVVDQTSGRSVAPNAPLVNLRREGEYIPDRTGRLTVAADGQSMEFTFDSDGKTLLDPPMLILPNLKLMQMENAVSSARRDLKFRVSGQVTEYKGRNYILLDKIVVVPDSSQQF